MSCKNPLISLLIVCSIACLGYTPQAHAQSLPDPQWVAYTIFEDAGDPSSPVAWTLVLALDADSRNGSSIGWHIEQVAIRQFESSGSMIGEWIHPAPNGSELWWVDHEDPLNPNAWEFAASPSLEGTAESLGSQANLDYGFQSSFASESHVANAAVLAMALADYYFQCTGGENCPNIGATELIDIAVYYSDPPIGREPLRDTDDHRRSR